MKRAHHRFPAGASCKSWASVQQLLLSLPSSPASGARHWRATVRRARSPVTGHVAGSCRSVASGVVRSGPPTVATTRRAPASVGRTASATSPATARAPLTVHPGLRVSPTRAAGRPSASRGAGWDAGHGGGTARRHRGGSGSFRSYATRTTDEGLVKGPSSLCQDHPRRRLTAQARSSETRRA
jgi:hypothetical protein